MVISSRDAQIAIAEKSVHSAIAQWLKSEIYNPSVFEVVTAL
jgi:hypothetical protein